MIKSMTGYGRGEYIEGDRQAIIEISAVNNRYLDSNIRMPRSIMFLEEDIRKYVKKHVARGKLDIYINYSSQAKEDISISVNETLCREYVDILRDLQGNFNLIDDISTMQIAKLPDVLIVEKNELDKKLVWKIIKKALEAAITSFNKMRQKEGASLKEDLILKSDKILCLIEDIIKKESFGGGPLQTKVISKDY